MQRELDYDGTKMVWEAIWSADTEHFHLFIVLAILQVPMWAHAQEGSYARS